MWNVNYITLCVSNRKLISGQKNRKKYVSNVFGQKRVRYDGRMQQGIL